MTGALPMTHDKALEAAARALCVQAQIDDGFAEVDARRAGDSPMHQNFIKQARAAITAYHAALEGQGEGEIAEIRKRLRALAAQTVSREDARLLIEVADKLTRLTESAAEAERLRTLQYALNSFIEAVKPLVDEERGNG